MSDKNEDTDDLTDEEFVSSVHLLFKVAKYISVLLIMVVFLRYFIYLLS